MSGDDGRDARESGAAGTDRPAFSLGDLGLVNAPPDPVFQDHADTARRLAGTAFAIFAVLEPKVDRIFLTAESGLPEPWASGREVPLDGQSGAPETLAPLFAGVSDIARDADLPGLPLLRDIGGRAALAAKVADPADLPVGFVAVIADGPRDWSAQDRLLVGRVAAQIGREILLRASLQTLRLIRLQAG